LARQACSVQQLVAPATRFTRSTSTIIFLFRAFDRCLRAMEFSERAMWPGFSMGILFFCFLKTDIFDFAQCFFY
jgi:hypothetical protein